MQVHPGGVDTKIPMKTHNPLETARADTSEPDQFLCSIIEHRNWSCYYHLNYSLTKQLSVIP